MLEARKTPGRLRRLTSYDFSPQFSAKVRAVVASPLGVLLLAGAMAALVGLAVHPRAFALAGGLLAVASIGVCWPWLTLRAVSATTRFDRPRTTEGGEVGATAEVSNPLPWPAWGLTLTDSKAGFAVKLPAVGGRSASECRWVFRPSARGEYPLSPPELATGFPFGLWLARRPAVVSAILLVWPRTYPVGPVPLSSSADATDGTVSRNKAGSTGDVVGVRPYRRGDSPRRIHWAQSARHDRLIVCELQTQSRPMVRVVVDVDPAVHSSGTDASREWAIRIAASLATGWLTEGAQVGLSVDRVHLPTAGGADHATRLMDALARVGEGGMPLREVFSAPQSNDGAGVTVIVTTDAAVRPPIRGRDVRWVILARAGFGGEPGPHPGHAWLVIDNSVDVPKRLRFGTAEARHGS